MLLETRIGGQMKGKLERSHNGRESRISIKEEGVSPIIATILMVAVTVALAATVYILVSVYTPPGAPFVGSLTVESTSNDTAVLQLTLASPSVLNNPSNFHIQIVNASSIGKGWSIENATITNPDGTVLYMNNFTKSNDIWTSDGARPAPGATSIESGAIITITFHSSVGPIIYSGMKIIVSYGGTTGSATTTL
jgi:flagellin-like protein